MLPQAELPAPDEARRGHVFAAVVHVELQREQLHLPLPKDSISAAKRREGKKLLPVLNSWGVWDGCYNERNSSYSHRTLFSWSPFCSGCIPDISISITARTARKEVEGRPAFG
jgi:hypothetical protein